MTIHKKIQKRLWIVFFATISFINLAAAVTAAEKKLTGTEAYSHSPASYSLPSDVPEQMQQMTKIQKLTGTLRTSFVIHAGGDHLRIRISNETGKLPLIIDAASVALADEASHEAKTKPIAVTFGGDKSVIIPAGAPLVSDPVPLPTKALDRLVVNLYSPNGFDGVVLGGTGMMLASGDQTLSKSLEDSKYIVGRSPVTGVTVEGSPDLPVIVTLGDSITDGSRIKADQFAGYPSILMQRLYNSKEGKKYSVVNAGIAGNRLLTTGWGENILSRLDRDVLRIPNVSHLIVLAGINDIGLGGSPLTKLEASASSEQLIAGYRQIIARAHAKGIKVIGATLMPFKGAIYYTEDKDQQRLAVNAWIRNSGEFDVVIDFDAITRDPTDNLRLNPAYDSGDHLHPSDEGYRAMGESIDLKVFN